MPCADDDRGVRLQFARAIDYWRESALLGAVDAVEEIWELTSVAKWPRMLGVGAVVDFLFRAGRKGDCMRLMSV